MWLLGFRGEDLFRNNQKLELPMVAMFVNESGHVSYWSISKKSSFLTLFGQMNQNLIGSIYGRFSTKIAHSVPIH
jgi:hypothetical protein